MATNPRKRQKQLAKKKSKRKQTVGAKLKASVVETISKAQSIKLAAKSPIHKCIVTEELFETGIGTLVISANLPNDRLGMSFFILDVYCLGVKKAMYKEVAKLEYDEWVDKICSGSASLRSIHQSCARKLTESCVDYAGKLGLKPHSEYHVAKLIFEQIDPDVCPESFEFGKDGKPYYFAGPNETEAESKRIVNTLTRKLGKGGFDFVIPIGVYDDFE